MRKHIFIGRYHGKGIHLKHITHALFNSGRSPMHHLSNSMNNLGLGAVKKNDGGMIMSAPHGAPSAGIHHSKKLKPLKFKF